MLQIAHIRTHIFGLTQRAFGEVAGVSQATVSRWETGQWEPNRDDLERIREAAIARGLEWNDKFFFEAPPSVGADCNG